MRLYPNELHITELVEGYNLYRIVENDNKASQFFNRYIERVEHQFSEEIDQFGELYEFMAIDLMEYPRAIQGVKYFELYNNYRKRNLEIALTLYKDYGIEPHQQINPYDDCDGNEDFLY